MLGLIFSVVAMGESILFLCKLCALFYYAIDLTDV